MSVVSIRYTQKNQRGDTTRPRNPQGAKESVRLREMRYDKDDYPFICGFSLWADDNNSKARE